ncbi:MAG TPA: DUF4249 domain-containing protein [Agriterribacter sp.]|nr:DUF4249 domain-containing protein [Agriterribacter sp.]
MRHTTFLSFLMLCTALVSCEKVIDIELKDAEKKYVVEATLADEPGTAMVLLSQTKNFSDNNDFEGIGNATVTITDDEGVVTALNETSAGKYESGSLTGKTGKSYSLKVVIDGNVFTASSTIPEKVNMDSLFISDDDLFGESRKTANVQYTDPAGLGQNYRFIQYVNGVKEKSLFIRNDDYTDGNESIVTLRTFSDDEEDEMKTGDVIEVDMLCIDPAIYKYWYSFESGGASGDNNSASPANPVSNITGGAIGYFSAHTIQRKMVTAP